VGERKYSDNRRRQHFIGVRFADCEYALLEAEMARTGKAAATVLRDAFLSSLTGKRHSCESCSHHGGSRAGAFSARLLASNAARARAAGHRNAGSATVILARFGGSLTARQRAVAQARAASPEASWTEIGAALGMGKDEAAGLFRRTLAAARKQLEASHGR